ncbi:MAG: glycerol-3-phosphate 1-O-acyltransferase PlsY [Spirochaetaceae bacterium]|nr:glycerol-3-phosphate 1-O-acyltransferase PlsY [Spirochaetaceae bacterium]MCF7949577.1 glycerol-3-phosphate 1-O-acyltransferase PlsY [Spirochaetia bacterium]MCF7952216.1 glycerol-3-phosphate 1-O-acyltransferase PlsY [Spirochaetaceae bacterium]
MELLQAVHFAVVLILSYLLGSIPSSIIIGKVFFKKDIREFGSGNAGGTNAVRVFGWLAGIVVILIDIAKGACAVLFLAQLPLFGSPQAGLLSADGTALAAGTAAVVGHIWTVFANFRGGKGVATAAGMIAALYPAGFSATLVIFVAVVLLTGIISVGSLCAAISFPLVLFALDTSGVSMVSPLLMGFSIPIAILIVFTHRKNIARLLRGEEKRLFRKK